METIFKENVTFTRLIFEEDRLACERAHLGTQQATRPGVLAESLECRLLDFRRTYVEAVADAQRRLVAARVVPATAE